VARTFKPHGITAALRRGCDDLLWLDASCVAVRPLEPWFTQIARDGYLLFTNGRNRLGEWASDVALDIFSLSRDRAMQIAEVNAAAIGLSAGSPLAREFLDRWLAAAGGVAFRGVLEQLRDNEDYRAVKGNRGGRVFSDPRVRGHRPIRRSPEFSRTSWA
jgi:hypothetical protein